MNTHFIQLYCFKKNYPVDYCKMSGQSYPDLKESKTKPKLTQKVKTLEINPKKKSNQNVYCQSDPIRNTGRIGFRRNLITQHNARLNL